MSDQQVIASALDALQPQMDRKADEISNLLLQRHKAEIVALYRGDVDKWGTGAGEGRAVLVATSGVPGAGKSLFVDSSLDRDRFFRIDPDGVRVHCLEIAQREGYLSTWLSQPLPDGQPPRLGELSTLVQGASTSIAKAMRNEALENGENLIMEGTLRWKGHPNDYLGDPHVDNSKGLLGVAEGYRGFEVYAVEVPRHVALEQAESRWWVPRVQGDPLARYMPPSGIEGLYPVPGNEHGYSATLDTALGMVNHEHAGRFDLARVNVLDRMDAANPVMVQIDHQPRRQATIDDVAQKALEKRGHRPPGLEKTRRSDQVRQGLAELREKRFASRENRPRVDPPGHKGPKL